MICWNNHVRNFHNGRAQSKQNAPRVETVITTVTHFVKLFTRATTLHFLLINRLNFAAKGRTMHMFDNL